jgi:hypothetical protein
MPRLPQTRHDRLGALVLVKGSPPDSAGPAQTPDSCLGVKGRGFKSRRPDQVRGLAPRLANPLSD